MNATYQMESTDREKLTGAYLKADAALDAAGKAHADATDAAIAAVNARDAAHKVYAEAYATAQAAMAAINAGRA